MTLETFIKPAKKTNEWTIPIPMKFDSQVRGPTLRSLRLQAKTPSHTAELSIMVRGIPSTETEWLTIFPERGDSNPDLCNADAVLLHLSHQAN